MLNHREVSGECLDENEILAFYAGTLSSEALSRIELHIDGCGTCRCWLSETAPSPRGGQPADLGSWVVGCFTPGQVIAGRYRIIRLLGSGGMGEVYEADDSELKERIGLKTVRITGGDQLRVIERFKREVSLARKVTHPNVCRIFDLSVDDAFKGSDRVLFLTMELLPGAPLSLRLAGGRMTSAEAMPIVRQIAEALDAAHRAGVVHRDFKSSNVMLVPTSSGEPRAVVCDFGLARAYEQGADSLSEPGLLIGSPASMAPEQIRGGDVGPSADIYALGVLLFEMMTGHLPFVSDTQLATLMKRLHEPAPSPRDYLPELPLVWEKTILRCLERNPRQRFASAGQVVTALDGQLYSGRPRWMWSLLGGILLIAFAALIALNLPKGRPESTSRTVAGLRPSAALVGFRDLSGRSESQWLSTAFTQMLGTELAVGEQLRVVPAENIERMRADLGLSASEHYASETLRRVRQQIAADWIVTGSYFDEGVGAARRIRFDVELKDARSGEAIVTFSEMGQEAELIDLVVRAGNRLRSVLGLPVYSTLEQERARAALPHNPDAARLFAEASLLTRQNDSAGARERFERAIALDPAFVHAHSALADVYLTLGLQERARITAQMAFERSGRMAREEQLLFEARLRRIENRWPQAIQLFEALVTFFPDNLEYGLMLARTQVLAGRSQDALVTTAALRRLPPPLGEDPRIDLREAHAWAKQGNWRKRLSLAERAIAKGRPIGARMLVADALTAVGEAQFYLGELGRSREAYLEAEHLYEAVGDQKAAIVATTGLARIFESEGALEAAEREYGRALSFYRQAGNEFGVAHELNALGQVYAAEDQLSRAKTTYDESLEHFRNLEELEGIGNVTANRAYVLLDEGDLESAAEDFQAAIVLFRKVGMRTHEAAGYGDLAVVFRRQGRFAEARKNIHQALEMLREIGDTEKEVDSLSDWGVLLQAQAEWAEARKNQEQALALARGRGEKSLGAELTLKLARLALDSGNVAEAETRSREALSVFEQLQRTQSSALGLAVLADSLVAQGQTGPAVDTVIRAASLVEKSENLTTRVLVNLAAARTHAAASSCGLSRRQLAETFQLLEGKKVADLWFEARLTRGLIELRCGGTDKALKELSALAQKAHAEGFFRIAELANAASTLVAVSPPRGASVSSPNLKTPKDPG